MMMRSAPPASASLAEMPVPAPHPMMGLPAAVCARSLLTISCDSVRRYKDHLMKAIKPASVSIELRTLRTAFNWAADKSGIKYVRENPFSQKNLIPSAEKPKDPLCLLPDEKERFLATIDDPDFKQLFSFYLLTAARRNEALNLIWDDIDLNLKQLTFRNTKTKNNRTIPISIELMQLILSLDRSRSKPFPFTPDNVTRRFKKYLLKAGLRKELHLHCLRHTAASDLIRNNKSLKKVSEFLGHSSIKTTEIYTHVIADDLRDLADTLTCVG